MIRRRTMAVLVQRLLALVLAYALIFGPALADMARGLSNASHSPALAFCLTSPDGSGPARDGSPPAAGHEECCLTGCRMAAPAGVTPAEALALPARVETIRTLMPGLAPQGHVRVIDLLPPATGPPACA